MNEIYQEPTDLKVATGTESEIPVSPNIDEIDPLARSAPTKSNNIVQQLNAFDDSLKRETSSEL